MHKYVTILQALLQTFLGSILYGIHHILDIIMEIIITIFHKPTTQSQARRKTPKLYKYMRYDDNTWHA